MAIEFECPHCGKSLKTSDDKAGVQAKCPGCSEFITVPDTSSPAAGGAVPDGGSVSDATRESEPGTSSFERDPGEFRRCPMCGEQIRAAAKKCRHCGEDLDESSGDGQFEPTSAEIGPAFEHAWGIFKKNVGICVAITLVAGVVSLLSQVPGQILQIAANAGALDLSFALLGALGCMALQYAVMFFVWTGQTICMLKLAQGKDVEISDLFRGGPYYLRSAGSSLLYLLMTFIGLAFCVVPGVVAMLFFWPYLYVIVDRNVSAIEGLGTARQLTERNIGTGLLLGLMILGLNLAGFAMCLVGLLFTVPLSSLVCAVMYLMISGQKNAARPDLP